MLRLTGSELFAMLKNQVTKKPVKLLDLELKYPIFSVYLQK